MSANHELGACSTRVLAADTDPQEAPTTSARVSAAPFGAAQRNPPKISYGGKKISNFFWRKQARKPPNTKAV
jgi:hypothetical protein